MADGQVYNIPAVRWEWFKKQLEALQKKAAKLSDDKVRFMVVGKHWTEDKERREIIECFVSVPEIRIDGYRFIGTVDHSLEGGNIVRTIPGEKIPQHFWHTLSECQHCQVNRRRSSTFIIECDDATHMQVGSSCLRDFTGHHTANDLAKLANILSHIPQIIRAAYDYAFTNLADPFFDLEWASEIAAQMIMDKGWTSQKKAKDDPSVTATAWFVRQEIRKFHTGISQWSKALALDALTWIRENRLDSEWVNNAKSVANSPVVGWRHLGILTSIIGVYYERNKRIQTKSSQHVGVVGQRLPKFQATLKKVGQSKYGMRHMFVDHLGNHYVWFKDTSDYIGCEGRYYWLDAKVRSHNEFAGIKQTDLNWLRITAT